jgi:hypothetical protein
MLGLPHQAASGVVLGNLRHWAAHVDVDDVGAKAFDNLRRVTHFVRVSAEDLNRHRALFFGVLGVFERPIDAAHESLGADHFGHHKTASAVTLHEPAKRCIGHAGHRRDDKRRLERN